VACKRAIDGYNQQRNDATERIDEMLLSELGPLQGARLNSETPGSMIDRLSIMSLKIRAMRAQLGRQDVDADHLTLCRTRLAVLTEQRNDLANCLDTLMADTRAGRVRFKVYRQMKMYNDSRFRAA
jgi:predicted amino acid racemase